MSNSVTGGTSDDRLSWAMFRRFLPYLWPEHEPAIRRRVVASLVLILIAKATTLLMPFAYKGAIDRMAPGLQPCAALSVALFGAYAAASFAAASLSSPFSSSFTSTDGERLYIYIQGLKLASH